MQVPDGLYYTKEHEWVRVTDTDAVMGITDHAQHELGDITYVELPAIGTVVTQGGELAVVESVKAASDIYAPIGGTVATINETLNDKPETINQDPYGDGWICKLSGVAAAETAALLSPAQYRQLLEQS